MKTLLIVGLALLSGCGADAPLAPSPATYTLRVFLTGVDSRITVPGTYPSHGDEDSVRVVGGSFELLPNQGWRSTWERVVVADGRDSERRTFDASGTYGIVSRTATMTVLDLYSGQVIPDVLSPTAVIKGDTLYHSAFLYAR